MDVDDVPEGRSVRRGTEVRTKRGPHMEQFIQLNRNEGFSFFGGRNSHLSSETCKLTVHFLKELEKC